MISKLINLNTKIGKNVNRADYDPQFLNFLNTETFVFSDETYALLTTGGGDYIVFDTGEFLETYESLYLYNSSLNKFFDPSIVEAVYFQGSEILIDIFPDGDVTGQETWNTCVLQWNKQDRDLLDQMAEGITSFKLIDKSDDSVYLEIKFDHQITADTLVGDVYTTRKFSLDNGIILIDQEILKQFDLESVTTEDFIISVSNTAFPDEFQLSNIAVTNSINVYFKQEMNSDFDNLDTVVRSVESGRSFLKKNEGLKSFASGFTLLHSDEFYDLYNHMKSNKSFPMYIFPYCESTSDESLVESRDSYIYSKLNFEFGGLYLLNDKFNFKNGEYDNFEFDLSVIEFI